MSALNNAFALLFEQTSFPNSYLSLLNFRDLVPFLFGRQELLEGKLFLSEVDELFRLIFFGTFQTHLKSHNFDLISSLVKFILK
jgi:hypothetical protein